ncbi:hypothetical protein [Luteimonas vadosa]|uniref:DUF2177 family protein n=1 Tax=Luteimonas vadosa TaxID=1165507 RepID=A0ABP9DXC3_9GAMM
MQNTRLVSSKRFWVCAALVSIATLMLDFAIHGWWLDADYQSLPGLYRPKAEAGAYFGWMLLAHACIGTALTWLYAQGDDRGKPVIGQGLRFGLALALFSAIPGYLVYYAVQPLPAVLVAKQILAGTVALLLLGVFVAWLQPGRRVLADPD